MVSYGGKRALLRPVGAAERGATARLAGYRVEHQTGETAVVLARILTAAEHPAELDRFAAPLQAAGQTTGRLVLIAEGSGRVVAQRALSRPVRTWRRTATPPSRPALRRLVDPAPLAAPSVADRVRPGPERAPQNPATDS